MYISQAEKILTLDFLFPIEKQCQKRCINKVANSYHTTYYFYDNSSISIADASYEDGIVEFTTEKGRCYTYTVNPY